MAAANTNTIVKGQTKPCCYLGFGGPPVEISDYQQINGDEAGLRVLLGDEVVFRYTDESEVLLRITRDDVMLFERDAHPIDVTTPAQPPYRQEFFLERVQNDYRNPRQQGPALHAHSAWCRSMAACRVRPVRASGCF